MIKNLSLNEYGDSVDKVDGVLKFYDDWNSAEYTDPKFELTLEELKKMVAWLEETH